MTTAKSDTPRMRSTNLFSLESVKRLLVDVLPAVKFGNDVPRFLRRFGVVDQLEIFIVDHAFIGQLLKIDYRVPILAAVEDDRNLLHPVGLTQAECVKQLIERAESTGEHDER